MPLLHSLSPDGAVFLATLGVLLLFLECNRPGSILPASLGLLCLLLAAARLGRLPVQPWSMLLLCGAAGTALFNLYRRVPSAALVLAGLGWVIGLRYLLRLPAPAGIGRIPALVCGALLGTLSAVLTRIAHRARCAKALN